MDWGRRQSDGFDAIMAMSSQFGHRVGWLPIRESFDHEQVNGLVRHVFLELVQT